MTSGEKIYEVDEGAGKRISVSYEDALGERKTLTWDPVLVDDVSGQKITRIYWEGVTGPSYETDAVFKDTALQLQASVLPALVYESYSSSLREQKPLLHLLILDDGGQYMEEAAAKMLAPIEFVVKYSTVCIDLTEGTVFFARFYRGQDDEYSVILQEWSQAFIEAAQILARAANSLPGQVYTWEFGFYRMQTLVDRISGEEGNRACRDEASLVLRFLDSEIHIHQGAYRVISPWKYDGDGDGDTGLEGDDSDGDAA